MRKAILAVIAILQAVLVFFQKEFGLSIDAAAVGAAAAAVVVYIFGEARNDFERIKKGLFQERKWADPAFWGALLSAVLPVINETFGLNLPVETIVSIVVFILGIIFAKRQKALKTA